MAKKDFSKPRELIEFTIDQDTFHAHPGIPAETLMEYGAKFEGADMEKSTVLEKLAVYKDALELCLDGPSFQRFTARLRDTTNPIDGDQLDQVLTWLFEQYGLRPTQPSVASSDGPSLPDAGTGSTGSIPGEVLISEVSLVTPS